MSTELKLTKKDNELVAAVEGCIMAREEQNHVSRALLLAKGIKQVKAVLSSKEVYPEIEALLNKPYGFLTDKDPTKKVKKYNKEKKKEEWFYPEPYTKEVIVDCVAEALSLGLYLHNNEFNLIAGRCYPAQAGFKRMLREFKEKHGIQTEVIEKIPAPRRTNGNQQSWLCECTVRWKLPETEKWHERVKTWNILAFSEDAAIGKMQKRACEFLYNELSGNNWVSSENYWEFREGKIQPRQSDIIATAEEAEECLTKEQVEYIEKALVILGWSKEETVTRFQKSYGVSRIEDTPQSKYAAIKKYLDSEVEKLQSPPVEKGPFPEKATGGPV